MGKNRIISAANLRFSTASNYLTHNFYLTKIKNKPNILKLGITHFDDVNERKRDGKLKGSYLEMISIAKGPSFDIVELEKNIKLKFNLYDETFELSKITEIIDYLKEIKSNEIILSLENLNEFVCK